MTVRAHIISWISKIYYPTASIRYCLKAKKSIIVPFFVVQNSFQSNHYTTKRLKRSDNFLYFDCDRLLKNVILLDTAGHEASLLSQKTYMFDEYCM